MKEEIEKIAKSIQQHRVGEMLIEATNNAVGSLHTLYGNEEKLFWLVNKHRILSFVLQMTAKHILSKILPNGQKSTYV